jgi:putative sigma-54 modulation protein
MPPIVVVTGRDEKITTRHKQHTEEKIAKLERYFDGIVKIEAVLGPASAGAGVELIISVRGGKTIVCQAEAKEVYAAIDLVLDKAEVQLTRYKEKRKGHRGEALSRITEEIEGQAAGAPAGLEEDEGYQEIVEKREF